MMFSRLAGVLLRKRLKSSPTMEESIDEAASQYLGKKTKIETAVDAVFAHDLRELAQADRDRVAAYAAAKVPGLANLRKKSGDSPVGDFIVCDDYRKGTGTVPAVIMGLVAASSLGLGGVALWAAAHVLSPPPPAVESVDTDTQYLLELVEE